MTCTRVSLRASIQCFFCNFIFTARIPKEWGRYCFHRYLPVPLSPYPPSLPIGGVPPSIQCTPAVQVQGQDGVPPSQILVRVTQGIPHPGQAPGHDRGVPPTRKVQHILAMRRAVCLLLLSFAFFVCLLCS